MNPKRKARRRSVRGMFSVENLDERALLSSVPAISPLLLNPQGFQAVRPNLPVMPFATPSKKASFIDPTVSIANGNSVIVGFQDFIGPYAELDGRGGAIKIGNSSDVLDNASIIANPSRHSPASVVSIGDQVVIGFGAKVLGPSTIGAFYSASEPTAIGAGALIDGATIQPGAIVSPRARVGPGVTVPSGYRVLPGANVTTDAEASDPKLGMVVPVTSSDISTVKKTLFRESVAGDRVFPALPGKFSYGNQPGANPTLGGINNGDLATVLGVSQEPGPSSASFEPSRSAPSFSRRTKVWSAYS